MTGPAYEPGFDNDSRYDVLSTADAHLYGDLDTFRDGRALAENLKDYIEKYDIDAIWDKGDFGGIDALKGFLDTVRALEKPIEVVLIPGDEDMKSKGWYPEAGEVEEIYENVRIEDRGFRGTVNGHEVAVAHHPKRDHREAEQDLFKVNFWANQAYYLENGTGRFYFLENGQQIQPPLAHQNSVDMISHAHSHAEYPRPIFNTVVDSQGALKGNCQMEEQVHADIPEASIQVNSFGEDGIDILSFDFEKDGLFQHLRFEKYQEQVYQKLLEGDDIGVERIKQDLISEKEIPHDPGKIEEIEQEVLRNEGGLGMGERVQSALSD